MIKYNKEVLAKIASWQDIDTYVIADFDRTITTFDSMSSWGFLGSIAPDNFNKKSRELFAYYHPYELDYTLDFEYKKALMYKWWSTLINYLGECHVSKADIDRKLASSNLLTIRPGAQEFLKDLYERNIPVIIMSAGVGNVIREFLCSNNCNYPNIYIVSNILKGENGIIVGLESEIIHSMNKNESLIPGEVRKVLENRRNIFLFGDQLLDLKMLGDEKREKAFKIGFLEENVAQNQGYFASGFDAVCYDNTSFTDIGEEIPFFRR